MAGRVSTPAKKAAAREAAAARKPAPSRPPAAPKAVAKSKPTGARKELQAIFARPLAAKSASPVAVATKSSRETAPDKPKQPKRVRDSFTMPKAEYEVLDRLKKRART